MRAGMPMGVAVLLVATTASATPARPPSTPTIAGRTHTFVALGDAAAPVKLAWSKANGVARYRARWTHDDAKIDIELPGDATAFERAEHTPGRHQLSVVAIDHDGRESQPAEVAVDVVTVLAIHAGATAPTTDTATAFAIGSRFSSPGLTCQLGGGVTRGTTEVVATTPGALQLVCAGGAGAPRVELPVIVAPVRVAGPLQAIARGGKSRVHLTVASVAPLGDDLQVEADGELAVGEPERTAHGIDVPVTVQANARHAALVIRVGAVELGRVELGLADGAPPAAPHAESDWFALELGGYVGGWFPPSTGYGASALGNPTRIGDVVTSGGLAGGRVGIFPTRRVGLEVEGALAMAGYADNSGVATVTLARAQLATRVLDNRDLGFRVVAGADLLGLLSERGTSHRDATFGVHWGAAFTVETRRNLWVRLQALDVVTAARDAGYAHAAELQLGVVTRLGRRDRWW